MNRRGFLGAILAAGVAPAFIKKGILMPVQELWVPPQELWTWSVSEGEPLPPLLSTEFTLTTIVMQLGHAVRTFTGSQPGTPNSLILTR